jgi:RIO-like serine/threonine protein kinase
LTIPPLTIHTVSNGTDKTDHIMYESDLQSSVSSNIIDGDVSSLNLSITDSELAVIVDIGEIDAAYTADEARELARDLKSISDQRWDVNNDDIVEYLRDLADVVDNEKSVSEVEEKWEDREVGISV